jgi:hypothetical protein
MRGNTSPPDKARRRLKTLGELTNLAFTFKPHLPVEAPNKTPLALSSAFLLYFKITNF